jgi:predicted CXXCH cytochrome family protein
VIRNRLIIFIFLAAIFSMGYSLFSGCNSSSKHSEPQSVNTPEFVGEKKCESCHREQHNEWRSSDHFKAMLPANDTTVLGDFNNAVLVADGVTNRFFKNNGKYFVNVAEADGQNKDYEILFTFGYFPLQQYLVEFPGGRMQSLRVSWNSRDKKWFHQYTGQNIYHKDWLHWTGNSQNWNTMCASCHSTNLKKNYDYNADSYNTTYTDINVACESCHGPGSNHVNFMQTGEYKKGKRLFNSGFVYSRDTVSQLQLNSCAPCHARKSEISDSLYHSGELLDNFIPQIITNEFFFADGQIKDEDYEYSSFTQSKMFHNNVKCSNCHNPHSGKLKLEGNNLCTSCHKMEYDNPSHHFHEINTEGAKCVNCHMAAKTYMGNDHRRDHSFRIPRPDQSVKYGTPNACNGCHKNESTKWAADAVIQHYGKERAYHFSDDLIPGSLINDKSEAHLIKLISDFKQPEIARATAANYLGLIASEAAVNALVKALSDEKALVRFHALMSLQNFDPVYWKAAAPACLTDKVRAVRIAAATLFQVLAPNQIPDNLNASYLAADAERQKYLHYQTDFSVGNVMLADYELQNKKYTEAVKNYLRGLQKDSLMNYARLNLSAAYNSLGQNENAINQLMVAAKIDPNNERIYYNLALLYYEIKELPKATSNFEKAVNLKSNNPSVYYNYGLLLQEQNKMKEAEKILLKGYSINPMAENLNYALAFNYLQQNLPDKAKKHAILLMQIDPTNAQYKAIYNKLGLF